MNRSSRFRSSSPGSKRTVDPLKAPTGTAATGSSADYYYYASPTNYYPHDGLLSPLSAERYADYRVAAEPPYSSSGVEIRPISSTAYRDGGQSTKLRTEYAVRPRVRSSTLADPESSRRPLSLVIPSTSSRQNPTIIASAYDTSDRHPSLSRHGYQDDADRYILPASSASGRRHRRVHSTDYGDSNRLDPNERRAYVDRGYRAYHRRGGSSSKQANRADPRNWDEEDYYNAVSYTKPSEQFERDSALRSNQRASARGSRRPLSIAGEAYLSQSPIKKDSRFVAAPPAYRGPDRPYDEDQTAYRSRRPRADSDVYHDSRDTRRHSVHRTPVSLHQSRDDGYTSYGEDYSDSRRHSRYRDEKSGGGSASTGHHHHNHRDSKLHSAAELLAPVIGGLASLGLAGSHAEDSRDSDRSNRGEHRPKDSEKIRNRRDDDHSDDEDYSENKGKEKAGREADERKGPRQKSRDRPNRLDQNEDLDDSNREGDKRKQRSERSLPKARRESGSSEDSSPLVRSLDRGADEKSRPRLNGNADASPTVSKSSSPNPNADDRPRKPVTVDPATPKEPDVPPKSILKPPREKFPEDKNPIREGVAPLKDPQRKGIPPGARWTKIDRRLVNPAALELGHERFEERNDYVIVLRVLTKEEIQAYALKTKEVRGTVNQSSLFFPPPPTVIVWCRPLSPL